jgi:hypothetical protein
VAKTVMAATGALTHLDWTGFGSLTVATYMRFYLFKTATPPANWFGPAQFNNNAAARCASLTITTGNLLRCDNAAGSSVGTSTLTLPNNQWVRIELKVTPSTTAGIIEYRLYLDPDAQGSSWSETKAFSGLVLGANIDQAMWGITATATNMNGQTWYHRGVGISTADWLGPIKYLSPSVPRRMPLGA